MKHIFEERFSRTILAASIAAIGFSFPLSAQAEESEQSADDISSLTRPSSEVELGVGYVSDDSYKFGDYKGLQDEGGYLIGNVDLNKRGDDNASYLQIVGSNLGLDSRNIRIMGGEQGNYGVHLEYDELVKLLSDSYQTPFVNPGSTNLTLPADWIRGNTTALMPNLNTSMRPFNVDTKRKAYSLGLTKVLTNNWDATVNFKRDNKDGNRFIGGVIGNSGGNPRAVTLPEPVDYTTDQFEAMMRYTGEKLQMQFGYYGSFFNNANTSLAWANPFSDATVWGAPLAGLINQGQLGLPPDNQFHQLNASGSYGYSKDTRVTGNLSYGRMTQNEAFLAYTVNPGLSVTTPLPRASLDGEIITTHADLKLNSRLAHGLHLTAAYKYDDRDNNTPQAEYVYIGGDSQNQAIAGATQHTRTNLPHSSTKQQVDAELDYQVASRTKLKFGYAYDWVEKNYEAIDSETEHTVRAGVDHRFNDMASGGLSYAYSDRDTSTYDAGAPFVASYTGDVYINGIIASGTGLWDNVPTQKKFFIAPRKRDKVRAFINAMPNEKVDLQFSLDYKNDDYHSSELGLREATGWSANFDAGLMASEALSGHFFASWENYESNQRSAQLGAVKANYLIPGNWYVTDITDRSYMVGVGFRFKPGGAFEFGGDASYTNSRGQIDVVTGALILPAATPMPDIVSRINRLELFGKYRMKKNLSLNLRYIYEQFSSDDWAYDLVMANTMANVIGTNQESPDYKVHVVGASLTYGFK